MPLLLDAEFSGIGEQGAELGESPFWDGDDCVWWVDIAGRKLLRTQLAANCTESWKTPEAPGFVVLTREKRPVIGMQSGLFLFSPEQAGFELLVPLPGEGLRFNDATIDPEGGLWASIMAMDAAPGRAAIVQVTREWRLRTVIDGLSIPNGLAADADAARLYVSDSHKDQQWIRYFPCDFARGAIGEPVAFASMRELAGRPDGAAVDARSGTYWVAAVDGGALYGFSRQGALRHAVPVPFPAPTKLAFLPNGIAVTAKAEGGHDGRLSLCISPPPELCAPPLPFWRIDANQIGD